MHFCLFWSICRTASQLYRLSHINALSIIQSYQPKDQSMKFWQKSLSFWQSWKTEILWGCPTYAPKQAKNTKNAFFACFRAYVRQPHGHIGWAKSMPFASINPTNTRTNSWNFGGICSALDEVEKLSFFESAILNFFFKKKKFFLLHSHENQPKFIW